MNKVLALAIGVLLLVSSASMAQAQQLFDFFGQADLPTTVGAPLSMYSVVRDPAPATTPLPLDFANFEYTLVVTGLQLDVDGNPQLYAGGVIALYEDAGTAADYANPGTFTDGTALLTGDVTTLTRSVLLGTIGSVLGTVNWTGGSHIGDFAPVDRLDWVLLAGTNSSATNVEPGYDEAWDGKVEPREPVVSDGDASWGSLKQPFQR